MSGLSRRAFMASTVSLAAAFGLQREALGKVLAAPAKPADVPTTLQQTIKFTAPKYKAYRTLVAGPGEPYQPRLDLLGKEPASDRAQNRRSLMYLGHLTDIHMIDAQSPARLEPMSDMSQSLWAGVIRPQDTLTVNVLSSMVAAMNAASLSPVTGAPMAAAVNTGDSADETSNLELRWYIDVLDGGSLTPNSGLEGEYQGVQVWDDTPYAYHPEDPSKDIFGEYGFPTVKGMLKAAVTQTVVSEGLNTPWYAVYGNHDTLMNGVIQIDAGFRSLAVGERKNANWQTLANQYLRGMATDSSAFTRLVNKVWTQNGSGTGVHKVTSDTRRNLMQGIDFIKAHMQTKANPGPVGHGFTQENVDSGKTYYSADLTSNFRVFGLDTCNSVSGPDGAVPQDQFEWLEQGLQQAASDKKIAIVISHHNSTTLENGATSLTTNQPLIHAEQFINMLLQYPNMVAWINGHTHINTITAHSNGKGSGFWEITSASCVDYPQQQGLIEFIDNRDGTMSIFTTTLDHTSPAVWKTGDFSQEGLASLSREFSANDWIANPPMRIGSPLDRNCELLLTAPFDLSGITDAQLEKEQAVAKARQTAHGEGKFQ